MTAPAADPQVLEGSVVSDPRWAELIAGRPSHVFHSPRWAAVLEDTYGFDVRSRVLVAGGEPLAGTAFVTVEDHLGTRHVGLPFSDFCDPLVGGTEDLRALLDDVLDCDHPLSLRSLGVSVACSEAGLAARGGAAWHRIDVTADESIMWETIDSGARRAIRKAEKSGVTVRAATSQADMRAFFRLHLGVRRRKYRLLSQPWSFFEAIWDRFIDPGHGLLLLAECDGAVVGGVVFLRWGDTLYYKFNASSPDALEARPNDAVLWNGMRWAHDHGLVSVDLGVSDHDQPGLIRYKDKYATERGEMTVWVKPGIAPSSAATAARGVLGQMTALLTDDGVPDDVVERAGDVLYRYFV